METLCKRTRAWLGRGKGRVQAWESPGPGQPPPADQCWAQLSLGH